MTFILPYSGVVDVTLTFSNQFPTQRGFSTILILTKDTVAGQVDAANRTKLYSEISELEADFAAGTETHNVASTIFSQNPRPDHIKVGFRDAASGLQAELSAIEAFDRDWYWLLTTKELNDTTSQDDIAAWCETRRVLFFAGSSDILTETANNATCVAARLKSLKRRRAAVFYHTDSAAYLAAGAASYTAKRNLDRFVAAFARQGRIDAGQSYTLKFKSFSGIAPINKPSNVVQAITGFVRGQGLSPTAGHFANTYVNIGGRNFLCEGNVASGEWIDHIHFADWITARMEEGVLEVLLNNDVVQFTDAGLAIMASSVIGTLQNAQNSGFIADDVDKNGNLIKAFEISHNRAADVPAAQRANRIAPEIKCCIRLASAIHWSAINIVARY
jgi:hypothetical protein